MKISIMWMTRKRSHELIYSLSSFILNAKNNNQIEYIIVTDPDDEESYTNKIEDTITRYKEANEDNFVRGFTDEEEFFYRKPTGNRKLGMTCSYCSFRYTCWPDLKYERNPKSKSANAYYHYTVFK